MMRTMTLLVAAAALVGLPLEAQQPRGMMGGAQMQMMDMGMMDSMMAPMMHSMATAPERLLTRKTALHLTDDQVSQLTALRDALRPVRDSAARQAMLHLREMDEVMHGSAPDTAAIRTHFEAAHQYMAQAHLAMLSAAARARALLSDEQRKEVDAMASMPRRPMMRRGGAMRRP